MPNCQKCWGGFVQRFRRRDRKGNPAGFYYVKCLDCGGNYNRPDPLPSQDKGIDNRLCEKIRVSDENGDELPF